MMKVTVNKFFMTSMVIDLVPKRKLNLRQIQEARSSDNQEASNRRRVCTLKVGKYLFLGMIIVTPGTLSAISRIPFPYNYLNMC
jgi:hypothetical protein